MASAEGLRRSVKGLSEREFRERFGTEQACRQALFEMRWREGLTCPACGHRGLCALKTRKLFQCNRCKKQVRLTAGTVFQDTKLPLTAWFVAIYHLAQGKNGISSIELGRRLGVKRQTAWLIKPKLMRARWAHARPESPSSPAGSKSTTPTLAASARAASAAAVPRARRRSSPRSRPRPSAGRGGCG
jgi:transposase-like protein